MASGKRSAILQIGEDLYRLKGCGNLDQGFPLEPMPLPEDSFEIRGCQFETTVFRELYFYAKINKILEQNGLAGGNFPIGAWKYED